MDRAGLARSHWSSVHLAKLPLPPRESDPREIDQGAVEILCGKAVPSIDDTWGPVETGHKVLELSFHVRRSRKRAAARKTLNRCGRCFSFVTSEAELRRAKALTGHDAWSDA